MRSTATPQPNDEIGIEMVREWAPDGEPRAVVVLVHGIGEHSGRYQRTGGLLAEAGLTVRAFDLIGFGASGGPRGDIDDWERFHDQIGRHVAIAGGSGKPVVLMGHSMGGNLVLGYVISDRLEPSLLVASAPALGGGTGWQRALAPVLARALPRVSIPNTLRGDQLSRDPAVGEAYFADPLVVTSSTLRLGASLFAAMAEVAERASAIRIPTLVLHGGADTIVPPQSTAALGELPGFERRLYPQLRHEILNEPEGPQIVAEIIDWVDQRV